MAIAAGPALINPSIGVAGAHKVDDDASPPWNHHRTSTGIEPFMSWFVGYRIIAAAGGAISRLSEADNNGSDP
jgi:hypothetical protein